MAAEKAGRGDPARTLALLWRTREPPTRGPRPGLHVEVIVQAAIGLVDAEGLDALSMRGVAERLGVGTMSLYTHVSGKVELIDVMLDAAYGEALRAAQPTGGWRAVLERHARQDWALFHRHPWVLEVAGTRPALGPNAIGRYESDLRAVSGIALTDVEMDSVVSLLAGHVEGAARRAVEAAQIRRRTGMTEEQWWAATGPVLETLIDADRYPLSTRVGTAVGQEFGAAYDPDHAFEFGLRRVLDGIEALVRERGR